MHRANSRLRYDCYLCPGTGTGGTGPLNIIYENKRFVERFRFVCVRVGLHVIMRPPPAAARPDPRPRGAATGGPGRAPRPRPARPTRSAVGRGAPGRVRGAG